MRLQLTWISVALMVGVSSPAAADDRAASWISVYTDNDRLTVISPQVSVRREVREEIDVDATYDVDIISAASVDVLTAASPRGYEERRHGLRLGATWRKDPRTTLSLSYLPGWEPDYRSHAVAVRLAREWVDRRLATRVDARIIMDRVGRSGDDMSRWRDLTTPAAAMGISWIFNPRTIGEVTYEIQVPSGFLASPYRFVPIVWEGTSTRVSAAEAVPDLRVRHAVALGARRAVSDSWYLWGTYRFYADSWSVVSHTFEVEAQRSLWNDRLIAGLSGRVYRQSAANFHREQYVTSVGMLPEHRSGDKMLAQSWSALGGLRLEASHEPESTIEAVRGVLKVEVFEQRFQKFAPLQRRRALILSLGATMEY